MGTTKPSIHLQNREYILHSPIIKSLTGFKSVSLFCDPVNYKLRTDLSFSSDMCDQFLSEAFRDLDLVKHDNINKSVSLK